MSLNGKKRKSGVRHYDTEEEISILKKKIDEEREKRRDLETEIFRLRQDRAEMCIKMGRLESSKIANTIPSCCLPLLVDAMAQGLNPTQLAESNKPVEPTRASLVRPTPVAPSQTSARPPGPPLLRAVTAASFPSTKVLTSTGLVTKVPKVLPLAGGTSSTSAQQILLLQNNSQSPSVISGSSGTKNLLVQHKASDGKVVSLLVPVTEANKAIAADSSETAAEPERPEGTTTSSDKVSVLKNVDNRTVQSSSSMAADGKAISPESEQISPESPPPENAESTLTSTDS